MSLVQSARLNGLDPYAYLKDVLQRLPTQTARLVGELLPHRWTPCSRPLESDAPQICRNRFSTQPETLPAGMAEGLQTTSNETFSFMFRQR